MSDLISNPVLATSHTIDRGGAMEKKAKKKAFNLHFIKVGNRSSEILKSLAKKELERVLAKHGAVSYNLDEVLNKYITEDICNDHKE